MDDEQDDIATAALLLNCAGVKKQIFPKTYNIRLSWGFCAYLVIITCFVFCYTFFAYWISGQESDQSEHLSLEFLLIFDACYLCVLFSLIFLQVPIKVIRENNRLLIVFCCRRREVPIESLIEIRIVKRRRKCCRGRNMCGLYPKKCFWGYPTNFDKNIIVVTDTTCNNYFLSLHEMEEFLADNWPEPESLGTAAEGGENKGEVPSSLEPTMLGNHV
eukprot:TRINITY_DN82644_c0_g1_i1.p1 TRINITY_DN82644_c0_g1~~TRINITY_DN82644_c0_g1_i1.p1  ORF type:complete len:217 (+),score=20.62 TRINITY_DN82644_c0_g1_i1:43-693(+)